MILDEETSWATLGILVRVFCNDNVLLLLVRILREGIMKHDCYSLLRKKPSNISARIRTALMLFCLH